MLKKIKTFTINGNSFGPTKVGVVELVPPAPGPVLVKGVILAKSLKYNNGSPFIFGL